MSYPDKVVLTELPDTLEGELVTFDEDTDGVTHELLGHLEDVGGHGGREEDNLGLGGKELEDVVDSVLETGREHLVGLVEAEHLNAVGLEGAAVDHVKHTAGGTDNDVGPLVELGNVLADSGTADTGMAVDVEVVAEGNDDLLDLLGELTGGGEDERLGLLDRGVNLAPDVS
jgi:hypothetical protein